MFNRQYVYSGKTFNDVYSTMFHNIGRHSFTSPVGPRGTSTREFSGPVNWTVLEPWNCWLTYEDRKLNPFFAAAEIFWILSGNDNVDWICRFNENMRTFSDEGHPTFNAGYGNRIRRYQTAHGSYDQLQTVVDRLKQDRDTRRAVVGLWDPYKDGLDRNDIACNNIVNFLIRGDKLHTTVDIRSNDFIWGVPYNMIQFQHLAMLVQGEYNWVRDSSLPRVYRGAHHVHANSLHMYMDNTFEKYDGIVDRMTYSRGTMPVGQEFCNEEIYFDKFGGIYTKLDLDLKHVEHGDFESMSSEGLADYWIQLAELPVLYLLNKRGDMSKKEILKWSRENLHHVFTWLIADFWNMKEEQNDTQ